MSNSSFWYDNKYNSLDDDSTPTVADDNMEKAALQRAIANFVSITTGANIPVKFNTKDSSYTDGQTVVLGGNINEKNFDHVVGLALHEASHVSLTDFNVLSTIDPYNVPFQQSEPVDLVHTKYFIENEKYTIPAAQYASAKIKDLINIIEDRRIDYHIFKNAPGYKGYYHSMYKKYFNAKVIDKALKNNTKVEETWNDYMFHLINMTNANRNIDALPLLRTIYTMIDLNNINRLKTTESVKQLAIEVFMLIENSLSKPEDDSSEDEQQSQQSDQSQDGDSDDSSSSNQEQSGSEQSDSDDSSSSNQEQSGSDEADSDSDNDAESSTLASDDMKQARDAAKLEKAIQAQKNFLDGNVKKSKLSKDKAETLNTLANTPISEYQTETGRFSHVKTIVIEKLSKSLIDTNTIDCLRSTQYQNPDMVEAVNKGLRLGKALGNKLQIRNRETVDHQVRQRKGKVDGRALSRLGFDDPTVFANTIISHHKDENLHISIDASGSMSGDRIENTITATAALAQALKMTNNMHLTVSVRSEKWNHKGHSNPLVVMVYDSKTDTINHIQSLWPSIRCCSNTPEGFCFPSIMKYLKPNTTFINFSDGLPGTSYSRGNEAIQVTQKNATKLIKAGHSILSYFIGEADCPYNSSQMQRFSTMYGTASQFIDVNNIQQLANTFNKHWSKAA
jgi:hypothetical protein